MSTYNREGMPQFEQDKADSDGGFRINGYQQVLELLVVADPEFRESLLARISERDSTLANSLRRHLAQHNN